MTSSTNELNKSQQEAVTHGQGPLLIIAGAGTGKTHVITERIKYLLETNKAIPSEILALTFTEKAAKEMEVRVDKVLPYGYTQMWITTFHSFGEKILRQEGIHIGLNPSYSLMTEAQSILFFRKHLFNFSLSYFRPLGNPNKFIESMLIHFSRLKDEDISPKEYLLWARGKKNSLLEGTEDEVLEAEKYIELADTYYKYEELKFKNGLMDFSDLISNTLLLFRSRKNLLREYQKKFKYILIDEFQDANYAQNQLAILLAGKAKNITVVGDDDQSIYRWRGAAVSNIIQFRKNFIESKLVVLRENYRSTQEILDRSYTLVQHNNPDRLEVKEKIDKKLSSARKKVGDSIEMIYVDKSEEEAENVISQIKKIVLESKSGEEKNKYSWKDIAILVRANNHAEPFVKALERGGIPYQFLGPGQLLRQKEVKNLIAYLKVIKDATDSVSLYRILSMDFVNVPMLDILLILNFSKKNGLHLFETLEIINSIRKKDETHWSKEKNIQSYVPNLSSSTIDSLISVYEMFVRHSKRIDKDSAGQILYYFLEDSGLLKKFTNYKTESEEKIVLNISKFFELLKEFEISHDDSSVSAVVDWLDMMMELGESPSSVSGMGWSEEDAVNILTIHASKGLEFPIVFLVNLIQGRFPSVGRSETIPIPSELVKEILPEGDFHLQEERRLFYVAMTRAEDKLFFSAAKWYGDGKRERKLSPFVVETLGEAQIKKISNNDVKNQTMQLSFLDFKKKEDVPILVKPEKVPLTYLSYSQIEAFNTCPLQYKYRYILKIPVPPTAAGSFGTSIHLSLQRFYEMVKRDENPTLDKLLTLLKDSWLPIGYGSRSYEDSMKQRGQEMLTTFYKKFYNPREVPDSLEQVFKIKLSNDLTIGGKIDRIDKTQAGKLEIVDYKTGKRPTDKQILENLQMTVYALAAQDPHIYNTDPENVTLTFYFLEKSEKVSSTRTKDQLVVARESLLSKKKEIENSSYPPKVGPWCKFCDFKIICEAWQ